MSEQQKVEYQEKWNYIRHTENLRYKVVQWYFVVVAAVSSFAFSRFGSDFVTTEWRVVTGFLFLYSLTIVAFLVSQKDSYQEYVDRIYKLDRKAGSDVQTPGSDPARYFFGGTLDVGAAATFAFFWSLGIGWWALVPTLSYVVCFAFWYWRTRRSGG